MYASQSEMHIARLPAGYERADDASLAKIGIYHIREVYPAIDEATETVDRENFSVEFDADASPLPVFRMTYASRPMTPEEIAARMSQAAAGADFESSAGES